MPNGLLFGGDANVMAWACSVYKIKPMSFDRAIGIIRDGGMVGAILLQRYNGYDIELSYYGIGTATQGIVRMLSAYIIDNFNPSRVTVLTSKRNSRLVRSLQKLGFVLEGAQRRYYGAEDCRRNTAIRLVLFRERLRELSGREMKRAA